MLEGYGKSMPVPSATGTCIERFGEIHLIKQIFHPSDKNKINGVFQKRNTPFAILYYRSVVVIV